MLMGAAYLLLVDTAARSLGTVETPLGILTALLGAPVIPMAAGARPHRLGMRLEARGLDFGYPGKPVGRGVSLAVGPGRGPVPARPQRRRQDHPLPHPFGTRAVSG